MRDKLGNKLTTKEFLARWKEGMQTITPEQKLANEVRSTFIMLIGYTIGLISLIVYRDAFVVQWFTWGLIIIFFGATWSNAIKWIALRQQLKLLRNLDFSSLNMSSIFTKLEEQKEE